VLLKFDTATIQSVVRRSGTKDIKVDGLGIGSPQAKLDAIFPDLIDPWKLAQDEPAARRRKVLTAMPATVTAEDLKLWTGAVWPVPEGQHGLDVVKNVRDHYYAERTSANKAAGTAESDRKKAMAEAQALAELDTLDRGIVVPLPGEEDAPVRAAESARKRLDQRKADADAMAVRTQGTRARIAELRAEADDEDASGAAPVSTDYLEGIKATLAEASELVAKLRAKLAEAERAEELATGALATAEDTNRKHAESDARAMALRGQAADLEATLNAAGIAAPEPEEFEAADQAIVSAAELASRIRSARKAHDAQVKAADLADRETAAKDHAKRLDDIIKRLDNDAMAELAKRANLIPGLTFVGDDIALDGHVFKLLSESEKTELCVDLVKRIAPEAKLLRIDRLEGMDPDMREGFIKHAKEGGWQILGTVVERGEMKIVTIDADGEQVNAPATKIEKAKGKRLTIVMPEG
jgi:hypothetical protein